MNCLYTILLCYFGFAFRHATCAIVKDFGKASLKTKSSPIYFSYKLSKRKPLFEIALCVLPNTKYKILVTRINPAMWTQTCIDPEPWAPRPRDQTSGPAILLSLIFFISLQFF